MKTRETSTREQALAWWKSINGTFKQRELGENYCKTRPISVIDVPLTGREIEQIYDKEVLEPKRQEEWQESQVNRRYSKPNQKQINSTYCSNKNCVGGVITFDGQTGRLCKKCNPVNTKQFKEFNESLFRAYISKFSDEDKLKAINCLGGFTVDQTVRAYSCGYGDRDANLPQFHGEKPVDYLNKLKH